MTLSSVYGWSNGSYSTNPAVPDYRTYGTHDWIAQHALDFLPDSEKQFLANNLDLYLFGTELPDNANAPGGKGIGDTAHHHVYYRSNGSLQDDASAVHAQQEYDAAVNYYQDNDVTDAVEALGAMTHYIADVAVFGHVMGNKTDWGAEDQDYHRYYEEYVNVRTDSYDSEFSSFRTRGILKNISAYEATIILANDTTFDSGGEQTCVWMNQSYARANWSDPIFKNRCIESLNLATNFVADVIHTFSMRTRLVGDINGDIRVDMKDISYVAIRFWCFRGDLRYARAPALWDSVADINADGRIDMRDIALAVKHFGEHYP